MPTLSIVQVLIEFCCILFTLLCLISLYIRRYMVRGYQADRERQDALSLLLYFVALELVSDCFTYVYAGCMDPVGNVLMRVGNFFVFVFIPLISYAGSEYIIVSAGVKKDHPWAKRFRLIMRILVVLDELCVVATPFLNFIYGFDEQNNYQRGPGFLVVAVIGMVMLFLLEGELMIFQQEVSRNDMIAMVFFIALPMVTNVIQTFYYGLALNNIAIFIATILVFFVYEIDVSNRLAERDAAAARQQVQIAELKNTIALSQIQPDFIFNILTRIERLCQINPKKAEEAIHHFSIYLDCDLKAMGENKETSFFEELKMVRAYVWLEKMRYGDAFEYYEEIETSDFNMPMLCVQPLIENAIKHAIVDDKCLHVTLSTLDLRDQYRIIIQDDGAGFDPENTYIDKTVHVGLDNVVNRIRNHFGGEVMVESAINMGTTVIIDLPKKK